MKPTGIRAIKVLNSLARPTIAVRVKTSMCEGWGSAPSGTSKSSFEAVEFIQNADLSIELFNNYAKKLIDFNFQNFDDFEEVEKIINVGNAGGSAVIALEYAMLNALAQERKRPLWKVLNPNAKAFPRILANVVGGGQHATNSIDIQEILVAPKAKSISEAVFTASEIYHKIRFELAKKDKHFPSGRTAEGAWTTSLPDETALEIVDRIAGRHKSEIGIDMAATSLFVRGKYLWRNFSRQQKGIHADEKKHIELMEQISNRFHLFYIEDPLHQDSYKAFSDFNKASNKYSRKLVCGDDLISTNLSRLKVAVEQNSINAVIIKPNQIGSLFKAKQVLDYAKKKDIIPVLSHRSGETNDSILAQLAFGWQVPFVKFGLAGGERTAKLNELIKVEQNL